MGLYQSSRYSELKTRIREQEQDRVLEQASRKITELAALIDNMHVPQGNVLELAKTAVSPKPGAAERAGRR